MAAKKEKEEQSVKYCKSDEIAELFGMTIRRVQQLTKEGVITPVSTAGGRKYDLKETVQCYIHYLSDKANGKSKPDAVSKLEEKKLRAEVALKESQGELHRLRTEIAMRKYISVEEVKIDYEKFFVIFKNFAMSIPSKVAGQLIGVLDPVDVRRIQKDLQKEITKLLRSFVISAVIEEQEAEKGSNGKA